MIKKIAFFIGFVLLIQLFRPTKNVAVDTDQNDTGFPLNIPKEVETILTRSCYDCHSNNTNYLWYHEIAPVSWLIASHVKNGKKHLNFDAWKKYNKEQKVSIFEDFRNEIEHNKMPMASYVLMHHEAQLSQDDKTLLLDWFASVEKAEKAHLEAKNR